MADFKDFIIAPQDLSGFEKIGDKLEAQRAAKAKAEQEKKKLAEEGFKSILSELQSKDFLSNTLADKVIIDGLQKTQNKAYALSSAGYDYNQMKMALSGDVYNITQKSQAAKNLATQLKANIDANKNVKGIDMDKYSSLMINNAFLNPDGSVKDEFDPTLNYDDIVKKTGDIYKPDEAIAEDVKNMPKNSEVYSIKKRDSKGNVTETKERIETAAGFEPYLDKNGEFQGVIPQHTEAPLTESSKLVNDYITKTKDSKEPLNLITDDHYERLRKSDPVIMGAVNKDTRDFAVAMNKELTPEEITTFQKAKIFDLYLRSGKGGFKHETVEAKLAPVTNVYNKMGGDKGETVRDIYGGITSAYDKYVRPEKPYLQLNLLKKDELDSVLESVRDAIGQPTLAQDNVYIRKDESTGDLYAYLLEEGESPFKGEGKPIVKIDESLNIGATPGTKNKTKAVVKTNINTPKSPEMSSFSVKEQNAIKAFAKKNGVSEKEAIIQFVNYKK